MPALSPTRRALALLALALGGFGIGCTEFVTMGLLPQIAAELVPDFAVSPQTAIAHAGVLVSTYALGVVVGAPIVAILGARLSQRTLALWLLVVFVVMTAASALMQSFELTAVARFLAGLPHGAYFGVASLLAGRIMGPGMQARGVALALSGLTIANVVGVPLFTWLGQAVGWRWAYIGVALVFAVTLALALATLPRVPGDPTRHPLAEIKALRDGRIWLMAAVGSIGFAGFFAIYSYIAEVTIREAGLPEGAVPWVLATIGVGMTLGNALGGYLSDRALGATIRWGFTSFIAALVLFALVAANPLGLFVASFLLGTTSSSLIPSVQTRITRLAGKAELLGAALVHSAFNIGNSIGAWIGGAVIAAGLGYLAPGWTGVAFAVTGFGLALVSFALDHRGGGQEASASA